MKASEEMAIFTLDVPSDTDATAANCCIDGADVSTSDDEALSCAASTLFLACTKVLTVGKARNSCETRPVCDASPVIPTTAPLANVVAPGSIRCQDRCPARALANICTTRAQTQTKELSLT